MSKRRVSEATRAKLRAAAVRNNAKKKADSIERMRARAASRVHTPNAPRDAALLKESPCGEWLLYRYGDEHPEFVRIKMIAKAPRKTKANFWLGIRRSSGELTRLRDTGVLADNYPALHAWLVALAPKLCGV